MSNGAAVFATELKSPKTEAEARAALHDPAWLNKVFVRDPSTISFILVRAQIHCAAVRDRRPSDLTWFALCSGLPDGTVGKFWTGTPR